MVLLFSLSAFSLAAEVCFEDEEIAELEEILTTLDNTVTMQESLLMEQEMLLTQAQTSIFNSKQEILLLNDSLLEAEKSWRKERIALIFQGSAIGLVVGVTACLILDLIFSNAFRPILPGG